MWDWMPFFTGAAATVIGVALGIPLGLWLSKRAREFQSRQEEELAE